MGNLQTRKRHADEEIDVHQPKRARFDDDALPGRSTGSRKRKLKNEVMGFIQASRGRDDTFQTASSYGQEGAGLQSDQKELRRKELMRDRCRSLDGLQTENDSNKETASVDSFQSCASLQRKEYPVPWLEALFLPEFPSRSPIKENSFLEYKKRTLNILNEIGYGSFGRVYRAVTKNNTRGIYALKVQQKSLVLGKNAVQQVRREVAVQMVLPPHIFIVRLYAAWQSRSKLFSVLQYPVGGIGDMFGLWRDHGTLPQRAIRIYGAELGIALGFLHDNGVIYRDLKMENIVLDSLGHVRVADFGLSKLLKNGDCTSTICGTLQSNCQYMAPDVASEKPYSHSVDWWSLAVVLHILGTGRYPYPNANATHHSHLRAGVV
ncbi:hypothetical protein RB195_008995 [Necator americanus]|uniref:Protein kinase domain-containing protein n=1 Tax=Necator americanus TaxID=51031 RepID=A0ABR1CS34_NECAM